MSKITCSKCGAENVPGWNYDQTLCITCTRDEVLGSNPTDSESLRETFISLVDEHFPKGECQERGQAMVLAGIAYLAAEAEIQKRKQALLDELEDWLGVKPEYEQFGSIPPERVQNWIAVKRRPTNNKGEKES